ncbi:hypothetical protein EV715DRAFT_297966 [Schizophyllum commune]
MPRPNTLLVCSFPITQQSCASADLFFSTSIPPQLDSGSSDGDDDSAQLQRCHIAISPTIKIVIVAVFSSLVIILLGLYLWWHVLQPIYHRDLIRRRHR